MSWQQLKYLDKSVHFVVGDGVLAKTACGMYINTEHTRTPSRLERCESCAIVVDTIEPSD